MAGNALADVSGVWAQANKPSVALQDPNDLLNKLIGAQQQVLALKSAQAQQARGEAIQQSINPLTGLPDMAQANMLMAKDSRAAFAMPDAIGQQQTINTSQNALSQSRNNYMGAVLGSLNKLPDDQLHDGAANAIGDAVSQGLLDQSTGMRMLARMPSDPAQARLHLQQLQIGAMAPGAGRDAIYGTPTTFNRGGTMEFGVTAPADQGGGFNPGSSSSMTMTPGDANAPVKIGTDAQGRDIMGTKGQFVDRAAGGASPFGDGRFPAALRNPNRPGGPAAAPPQSYTSAAAGGGAAQPGQPAPGGQPPQPVPNAAPGGGIVMGPGVAQQAAMTRTGTDAAGAFQGISDQGVQARSQSAVLGTMLADAQNFPSGETTWNNFKTGFMRNAPGWASSFGITPESVASLESFDKFANQLAGQQGAGSDARLAVAQGGNPSSKMSQAGVDVVLRQLQGNADYLQARAALAAKHPDPSDVRGFEATTGAQLDPRAFQVNRMTQAQRQAYDKSLSSTDRAQVEAAYNYAHKAGLFTAPAAAATPPAPAPAPAAQAQPPTPLVTAQPVFIPPSARGPSATPQAAVGGALRGTLPPRGNPLSGLPAPGPTVRGY